MRKLGLSIAAAALVAFGAGAGSTQAHAAGATAVPPQQDYQFTGFFGTFDRAAAQRGLQVYKTVCASCHGMDLIRYRELADLGYSEDQIKAFASEFFVRKLNEDGEMEEVPAEPSDRFVNPYRNDAEAAALNGGKAPPDLSLIVKSRAHGLGSIGLNFLDMLQGGEFATGASYIAALLGDGYILEPTIEDKKTCNAVPVPSVPTTTTDADWNASFAKITGNGMPADISYDDWRAKVDPVIDQVREDVYLTRLENWEPSPGTYFNKWFPGCSIGMPQPLYGDDVEYADGTEATIEQQAYDLSVFLAWASEPTMEERKQTGVKVLLFLAVFTGVLFAVKRQTWSDVKKH